MQDFSAINKLTYICIVLVHMVPHNCIYEKTWVDLLRLKTTIRSI